MTCPNCPGPKVPHHCGKAGGLADRVNALARGVVGKRGMAKKVAARPAPWAMVKAGLPGADDNIVAASPVAKTSTDVRAHVVSVPAAASPAAAHNAAEAVATRAAALSPTADDNSSLSLAPPPTHAARSPAPVTAWKPTLRLTRSPRDELVATVPSGAGRCGDTCPGAGARAKRDACADTLPVAANTASAVKPPSPTHPTVAAVAPESATVQRGTEATSLCQTAAASDQAESDGAEDKPVVGVESTLGHSDAYSEILERWLRGDAAGAEISKDGLGANVLEAVAKVVAGGVGIVQCAAGEPSALRYPPNRPLSGRGELIAAWGSAGSLEMYGERSRHEDLRDKLHQRKHDPGSILLICQVTFDPGLRGGVDVDAEFTRPTADLPDARMLARQQLTVMCRVSASASEPSSGQSYYVISAPPNIVPLYMVKPDGPAQLEAVRPLPAKASSA
eukprot:TRINITY_DN41814_c0_g1_i1.p1 TRINITY_DN41814_c0_g1~~TRINITY_DN41814_c0_g1_i1.p1  ORF type:complete len:449 (-),score=71.03 TRINITY_DN41814_c0_g1_i1:94-1440(-)